MKYEIEMKVVKQTNKQTFYYSNNNNDEVYTLRFWNSHSLLLPFSHIRIKVNIW